ncbi:hypothetical protein SLS60_009741 [Paraconiothyrium brasiliense]|uniref:Uncharacterized protein n=1 Tax=Paraconiothyrium brasiliense TaxID=300254 RepID=A0ABR3QSC2_9PLEO
MASDAAHLPSLVPKSSKGPNVPREDTARRKSASKSRNGMFVFVSQLRSCYKKDIRFRPVERAPAPTAISPPTSAPTGRIDAPGTESTVRFGEDQFGDDDPTRAAGDTGPLSFWPWVEEDVSNIPLPDFDLSTLPWMDFSHLDFPSAADGNETLEQIMEEASTENGHGPEGSLGSADNVNPDSFLPSPDSPSLNVPNFPFFQNIEIEADDREEVESLFHQECLTVLSIWEDRDRNPWRTMIWPMTQESKALYHAVAAMTFLMQSKYTPNARDKGLIHARKSTQQLAADLSNGEIQIDTALAATIALGFAEAWDFQKSSTGRTHIQGARILLQQSISQLQLSQPSDDAVSARLRFLANTWIYMDTLARLTSDCGPSLDPDLLHFFTDAGPLAIREELDPLMGYAASLFPIIGRVADLIATIRTRNQRRNSPIIISKGIELRHVIEDWSPAVDLEQVAKPTSNMIEAIQTAEAYRWATLLLLQEAVPELPSLVAYKELGQKTLVYLATIPSNSATINVHTYPLMVAATEAVEEEDREFVRDRWNIMRKRMVNGIIDRCEDVMEEVWRRRDAHFSEWLARNSPDPATFGFSPSSAGGIAGLMVGPNKTSPGTCREKARSPTRRSTAHSDFPISIAFKKGVDPITRSGNVDYTVKGNLHWIEIMQERGWEGTLLRLRKYTSH